MLVDDDLILHNGAFAKIKEQFSQNPGIEALVFQSTMPNAGLRRRSSVEK